MLVGGESDVPTCGPPASFSVHRVSSAVTLAGCVHKSRGDNVGAVEEMKYVGSGLQTTQPTSGGAVTADRSCCANCVQPSRPQQWGPDLPFFWACRPCGPTGWLALLLTKAGDVETNPGPTTLNKKVWICDICHKQIHVRKADIHKVQQD